MNIIAFLVMHARKQLFGTNNGHEPSPEPSSELRLATAAKSFDVVLLELHAHIHEMFKQRTEVRGRTLAYLAGIGAPNHMARVTALDLAEDKLDHLVSQNIRRLADLTDRYAGVAAEHTYQNLIFAKWGAEANALSKSAKIQLMRHRQDFTTKVEQVRSGKTITLPADRFAEEQIRLLRARADTRRSGMTYCVGQEDSSAPYLDMINQTAHMCSW